jgi:ubiquinone/menaquinone biosynthesis C-methylase UbiE
MELALASRAGETMKNTNMYPAKTRYQKKSVADEYEPRRFYSLKGKMTDALEKKCLLHTLDPVATNVKALDIPCGTGRITEVLVGLGMDVTAADVSQAMMEHANVRMAKNASPVPFVQADIENLGFPENAFDLIVTIRLLHHIPPSLHRKILAELHRVTRNWVVISFSSKYSIQSARRNLLGKMRGEPRYSISPALFRYEVANAGFRIVRYISLLPLISESVFVLLEKLRS